MTGEEKLRALLAEARAITQDSLDSNTTGFEAEDEVCKCNACERYRSIIARIDAAFAEPVADYDIDADLRMHKQDRLRLRTENLRLTRERDEARAEVERLRSLKPIGTYSLDWNHEQERMTVARAAYQRGAEAMREAAAKRIDAEGINGVNGPYFGNIIRALPIPEEK
jgi:hypothetical protein